jgi:hypothetical protein
MPPRQRKPSELTQQVIPLLLLAIGLVTTNNSAPVIDDEALILDAAARPLHATLSAFFSGAGTLDHPPLYDVLLHFWLKGTQGNFDFLRIPSILFFIAGLFLLSRATRYFTGPKGGYAVIWLGVLWPFSFHFARLSAGYSFSFFLVAGLTLSYFNYLQEQTSRRLAALFLFGAALLWTSYFGWAILACLALDHLLRWQNKEQAASSKALLGTSALLVAIFIPLISPFRVELSRAIHVHNGPVSILANMAFNVYSLFVSESVAPWFWWLSIPVAVAILSCLILVGWWLARPALRLLLYGALLIVAMALIGILQAKYLLMISPWVLLPAGIAIETVKPRWATFGLAGALLVIGAAGWYGIYSKRFYSAPQFIEPWQEIAADAVNQISGGATVIADHPSFLFYLTYYLRLPIQNVPWRFEGLLPDSVTHPQVFSPQGWLNTGHPTHGKMMVIRAGRDLSGTDPIDQAINQLDQSCGSISSRLRMRDTGYAWKQRFFPNLGEPLWRIEIREYDCNATNSKQIYPLPSQ